MNSIHDLLFLQYPTKARGQVTVAATVTAIITNHCSSQKEKNFTQVKADFLPDFPQHPMLLSAYLKELIPQPSSITSTSLQDMYPMDTYYTRFMAVDRKSVV